MNKPWWLVIFIVLSVLLGAGVIFLATRPPRGEPVVLIPPPTTAPITIHVSGAVNMPGLYNLPPGSRVNDAIQAAGGFNASADASLLNLARILEDGEQVVVLALPTPSPTSVTLFLPDTSRGNPIPPIPTLIDINTATLEQLDTLPGIGPAIAQLIIDYRNSNGPFKKIEDIIAVDRIGQATFDKIKDMITVGTSLP